MYIARIRLENIRGFRELDLDLRGPDGQARLRPIIIGQNGTGKTTVLRAVALGLCDQAEASALLAEPLGNLISEGAEEGRIEVLLENFESGGDPYQLTTLIQKDDTKEVVVVTGAQGSVYPQPFICGYGAGRFGVGSDVGRDYRITDSTHTLFADRRPLLDPELTLRRLKDYLGTSRYEAALLGIKKVLGLSSEDEIRLPKGGGVQLSGPTIGGTFHLEGWAGGYRTMFSLLLDLYGWALRADRITASGSIRGIVLVDEVDQHLHPSMQAEIMPRLSAALPEVQLFVTTHSPLVALDAKPEELVALRWEGGQVVAERSVPDFSGYSAEDMLADERLFDTNPYAPEMRETLSRYRSLAAIPKAERGAAQTRELRDLALDIEARPLPESREGDMVRELKRLINKHGL
jgi:hypothetical protein